MGGMIGGIFVKQSYNIYISDLVCVKEMGVPKHHILTIFQWFFRIQTVRCWGMMLKKRCFHVKGLAFCTNLLPATP